MNKSILELLNKVAIGLDKLSGWRLVAVSVAAAVLTAILLTTLAPYLFTGMQHYDDLVVGQITMQDVYKHGDIVAAFTGVFLFFTLWCVIALVAVRYSRAPKRTAPNQDLDQGWLPYLFFSYFLGIVLFNKTASSVEVGIIIALTILFYIVSRRYKGKIGTRPPAFAFLCGIVTAGGLFFSAAGLAVASKFLFPQTLLPLFPEQLPVYLGCLGLLAIFLCLRLSQRSSLYLVYGSQFLTPLLLLVGFTRVYHFNDQITANLAPWSTRYLAIIFLLSAFAANALLIKRKVKAVSVKPRDLILLPSVVAVAAFMAYSTPAYLETDLFHTGEDLLAWHQIFEKGQFPFSEFALARGFYDVVFGLLNFVFFDSTYATFSFSAAVYFTIVAAVIAVLVYGLLGAGWAAVFMVSAPMYGSFLTGSFLIPFLVLVQPRLISRPLRWLFVWLLLAPLSCLYHTTTGIAVAVGSLPLAAWIFHAALNRGLIAESWHNRQRQMIGGVVVLIIAFILLTPLLVAWISYVLEQGQANEVANGLPLFGKPWTPPWFRWDSPLVWNIFRAGGWLFGCYMLWHIFIREWANQKKSDSDTIVGTSEAVSLVGIGAIIISIPYIMGRIDYAALSRTGWMATVVIGILLPLALLSKKRGSPVPTLFGALFLIGVGNAPYYKSPIHLAHKAVAAVEVPEGAKWVEGNSMGLTKFGDTFADKRTVDSVLRLKAVTERILRSGETYLDLTNLIGYHYLLDHKVSSVYDGYYTVTSERIQNRVIGAIKTNPPPLVWTGPVVYTFGSGIASLRSYRLYRWLLQSGYVPFQDKGLSFLLSPERYKELFTVLPSPQQQAQRLAMMFNYRNLKGIPLAWGKNMEHLTPRFNRNPVRTQWSHTSQTLLQKPGASPVISMELSSTVPINGGTYDFMLLRFTGGTGLLKVGVSWSESENSFADWRSLRFDARSGIPLLIPLGSHPDWLLSRNIGKIKLAIIGLRGSKDVVIQEAVLLSLVR